MNLPSASMSNSTLPVTLDLTAIYASFGLGVFWVASLLLSWIVAFLLMKQRAGYGNEMDFRSFFSLSPRVPPFASSAKIFSWFVVRIYSEELILCSSTAHKFDLRRKLKKHAVGMAAQEDDDEEENDDYSPIWQLANNELEKWKIFTYVSFAFVGAFGIMTICLTLGDVVFLSLDPEYQAKNLDGGEWIAFALQVFFCLPSVSAMWFELILALSIQRKVRHYVEMRAHEGWAMTTGYYSWAVWKN